jgi:hypothetical protein
MSHAWTCPACQTHVTGLACWVCGRERVAATPTPPRSAPQPLPQDTCSDCAGTPSGRCSTCHAAAKAALARIRALLASIGGPAPSPSRPGTDVFRLSPAARAARAHEQLERFRATLSTDR